MTSLDVFRDGSLRQVRHSINTCFPTKGVQVSSKENMQLSLSSRKKCFHSVNFSQVKSNHAI